MDLFELAKSVVLADRDRYRRELKLKCGLCGQYLRGHRDMTRHKDVKHGIKPHFEVIRGNSI